MSHRPSGKDKGCPADPILPDEKGSAIVIAVLVLALMSIIGIASTNLTITESFITRNTAIRKQTQHMADAVALEACQRVLDAGYNDSNSYALDTINPSEAPFDWIHYHGTWDWSDWNDPESYRLLNPNNSNTPQSLSRHFDDSVTEGVAAVLSERGELGGSLDDSPIRYALVGWQPLPGDSIKESEDGRLRSADLLVEYASPTYGIMRLTVGVRKRF